MFIIVRRYYFRKIVDDWDSFLIRSIRRSGKFPQKFLKERKDRKYVDVRLCVYSWIYFLFIFLSTLSESLSRVKHDCECNAQIPVGSLLDVSRVFTDW